MKLLEKLFPVATFRVHKHSRVLEFIAGALDTFPRGEPIALYAARPDPRWIAGRPREGVELAWLLVAGVDACDDTVHRVVLGALDHGEWCECKDWRGEYVLDEVYEPIVGWMPYDIPLPGVPDGR